MEQTANQVIIIDWNTFFWVLGVIVTVFGALILALSFFYKATNKTLHIRIDETNARFDKYCEKQDQRMEKNDEYMKSMQEQIRNNSEETKLALQAIQLNQESESKRIEAMNGTFAESFAIKMIEKLQFMRGEELTPATIPGKGKGKR